MQHCFTYWCTIMGEYGKGCAARTVYNLHGCVCKTFDHHRLRLKDRSILNMRCQYCLRVLFLASFRASNYLVVLYIFQLKGDCDDIAENVALALSIITLFVLCEPRDQVSVNSLTLGYNSTKYRDIMGELSMTITLENTSGIFILSGHYSTREYDKCNLLIKLHCSVANKVCFIYQVHYRNTDRQGSFYVDAVSISVIHALHSRLQLISSFYW